jgi:hypothetical protein
MVDAGGLLGEQRGVIQGAARGVAQGGLAGLEEGDGGVDLGAAGQAGGAVAIAAGQASRRAVEGRAGEGELDVRGALHGRAFVLGGLDDCAGALDLRLRVGAEGGAPAQGRGREDGRGRCSGSGDA